MAKIFNTPERIAVALERIAFCLEQIAGEAFSPKSAEPESGEAIIETMDMADEAIRSLGEQCGLPEERIEIMIKQYRKEREGIQGR